MFTLSKTRKKKTTAQAMVEFALALPVLLLVVYGLIETGRLLFIYASVVTAARQGSRYGSATGKNVGGTFYYQDCNGITGAANTVAFLNPFSAVAISYDQGLDSAGKPIAFTGALASNASCTQATFPTPIINGDRITVQVSAVYAPIVPLVPITAFTISSSSSRTLLGSISIGATAPAQQYTGSGGVSLQVTTNVPTYANAGQVIAFTYTLTNTSAGNLTSPYVVTDSLAVGENCGAATSPLAQGASTACTGSYTITQADLDNGSISGLASATANGFTSNSVTTTILALQSPTLSLVKSASTLAAPNLGQVVTYSYALKNTGNVTLVSPFAVADNKVAGVDCSSIGASLLPNATGTCTGSYTITAADITAGAVTNTATATAVFSAKTITSNSSSATVGTKPLFLSINAAPATVSGIGQVITYTYTLLNASNATMNAPYHVTDNIVTGIVCPGGSLIKNTTLNCTGGTYTTTQADVDAGVVTNIATATSNGGAITSNQVSASIIVTQNPALLLTISPLPTIALSTTPGTIITYTFTLRNTGTVTLLSPFAVTDDKVTTVNCAGATSPLAVGATTTCTGTYTIIQADIDGGSLIDHATATGKTAKGLTVTSAQATSTVITHSGARLGLVKTSNPTFATSAGVAITYTYTLKNTGGVAFASDPTHLFTISDNKVAGNGICLAPPVTIPVGGSTTCTNSYTTTAADLAAGFVTNSATAKAWSGGAQYISNLASATVQVGAIACDPRHSSLTTAPFGMTVFNESASSTITISSITIFYNATHPANQFITSISYGGVTVFSGASSGSPGTIFLFTGNVTLAAGSNKLIGLLFNNNYIPNGTEQIVVNFAENGCPVLDSNNNNQLP